MAHEHRRPVRPLDWPIETRTPAQFEFDLLAELAKDPANGLEQISPGVYRLAREAPDTARCPFCRDAPHGWVSGSC